MTADISPRFLELAVAQLWQVTLLAIAVGLVARLACRRRPHLAYLLWMLVVVKCVTPPVVSSPTGVFSWVQLRVAEPPTETIADAATVDDGIGLAQRPPRPRPTRNVPKAAVGSASADAAIAPLRETTLDVISEPAFQRPPATTILFAIWLAGVVLCGIAVVAKSLRFRRLLNRSATVADSAVQDHLAALAQRLRVRRRVRLLVTDQPIGPAVFGVLRPTILLPAQLVHDATPAELEPILAHELIHLRRGDTAASLSQLAAQIAWWFHPLVWWANREARRERERACDEEVVTGLSYPPAQYARVLVDLLDSLVRQRRPLFVSGVPMLEVTARRLAHIVRDAQRFHAHTPRWQWLVALALLVVVLPGAGMTWEEAPTVAAVDEHAKDSTAEPAAPTAGSPGTLEQPYVLIVHDRPVGNNQITSTTQDPLSSLSPSCVIGYCLPISGRQLQVATP